jgi:large subunit ribosomal protein L3
MVAALLGRKVGMTQVFDEDGMLVPVTVIEAGPCTVLQVREPGVDGYHALQLGFEDVKAHRSTLPEIGHASKAGSGPKKVVKEVRYEEAPEAKAGDVLTVEVFEQERVQWVDVMGTTKGRGFSGGMRRYGFGGQPASHGVERKHRSPGGIGGSSELGRGRGVKKGKHMAGQHGHVRRTVKNQRLVKIDKENNLLLVRGSIPGPNGGFVFVRQAKTKG